MDGAACASRHALAAPPPGISHVNILASNQSILNPKPSTQVCDPAEEQKYAEPSGLPSQPAGEGDKGITVEV